MVLTGESNVPNLIDIPSSLAHSENSTLKLSKLSPAEKEKCLRDYTLFLVTRHPFERLLSAYRNKFLDSLPSSRYFQVRLTDFSFITTTLKATVVAESRSIQIRFSLFLKSTGF